MAMCATADSHPAKVGKVTLGETLGAGQFGKVRLGTNAKGETVAVKSLNKSTVDMAMIKLEVNTHILLRHPNIVRLWDTIETATDMFLVMEYANRGDLFDYIISANEGYLAEDDGRAMFSQILAGVEHCHKCMVTHRDLKPENILLYSRSPDDAPMVKIADFGLSATIPSSGQPALTEPVGSPNYSSPEMFKKPISYRGPEVDIWSLGVVLYVSLCGTLPFDAVNPEDLGKVVRRGAFRLPIFVPMDAKKLIRKMLDIEASERITIAGIKEHAWLAPAAPAPAPEPEPVEVVAEASPAQAPPPQPVGQTRALADAGRQKTAQRSTTTRARCAMPMLERQCASSHVVLGNVAGGTSPWNLVPLGVA